jgi:enoyl-CoA hydratase/methylglutaconyl-CoA hydratase
VVPDQELPAAVAAALADLRHAHPQGLRETKLLINRDLVERIDSLADEVVEQSARLFAEKG